MYLPFAQSSLFSASFVIIFVCIRVGEAREGSPAVSLAYPGESRRDEVEGLVPAGLAERGHHLVIVDEVAPASAPAHSVKTISEASGSAAHHGFKAMQISASALTAEALKLTVPAAAFSRSTESHNQNKVSMGTIAARDCRRIVDLSETVAVIALLAACQALDLRAGGSELRAPLALRDAVRKVAPMVVEDRRQDRDIERVLAMLREGALPLGSF